MKRRILPVLLLAAVIAAGFFGYRAVTRAAGDADGRFLVSGVIEVTDAEVAFKVPGRVESRLVSEGDEVKRGQPVATLESADLAAEVDLRKADLAAAGAALSELENGSRKEEIEAAAATVNQATAALQELENGSRKEDVDAAEARLAAATAEESYRRTSFARSRALLKQSVIPSEEHDRARQAWEAAQARVNEARAALALVRAGPREEEIEKARAALALAKSRQELVAAGPRPERIAAAKAGVARARAALDAATTRLAYAKLASPLSGVVLSDSIEPGEVVAPGTAVVTVADLDTVWMKAWIPETDLGRVKLGQAVRVTADTWPGKVYRGRITFLSSEAEFTPKNVQTPEQRVKLVYRIKVTIPNPDHELKPGMPVDGEILLGGGA